jgi:hypothetical protein
MLYGPLERSGRGSATWVAIFRMAMFDMGDLGAPGRIRSYCMFYNCPVARGRMKRTDEIPGEGVVANFAVAVASRRRCRPSKIRESNL